MVLYFGGLDDFLHATKTPSGPSVSQKYVEQTLDPLIGQVMQEASAELRNTAVFGLVADHGHIPIDPVKRMDLDSNGSGVPFAGSQPVVWHDVLVPNKAYRPSKTMTVANSNASANVIFTPHGGMTHVYVAQDADAGGATWNQPPSLKTMRPLINNIYALTQIDPPRTITDILVRVPPSPDSGTPMTFANSTYEVVPPNYQSVSPECVYADSQAACPCANDSAKVCTLEGQLLDLGQMTPQPPLGSLPSGPFDYAEPERRVNQGWRSENTGDIVLLPNMESQFYFDNEDQGSGHGSLTYADSLIALAFSYPGATSKLPAEDNVLASATNLLRALPADAQGAARSPVEEQAMECALGGGISTPDPCPK